MTTQDFTVGFGEVDITPPDSVLLAGYYYDRQSTGVHDPLHARSMAVSDGVTRAVLCVADLVHFPQQVVAETQRLVRERSGLEPQNLLLSTVHTHTGPDLDREEAYSASLPAMLAESVRLALEDLRPTALRAAHGEETTRQFIRRYRMKDGSVVTNPGIMNPDVVEPIGTPDREVAALVASSDGKVRGGLVSFGLHCDTVGGTEISADWTYFLRERLRKNLAEDLCLLTPIACCGDVNHWNVFKPVTSRGFALTEEIGARIADAATEAIQGAEPVAPGPVRALRKRVEARTRMPSESELAEARAVMAQPAPEGVDFTMERVDATRKVAAAELGPTVGLDVTVLTFGNAALVGIPAEYFSELGRDIKSRSPFEHTVIITLAARNISYVGAHRNYEEGGYEMTTSVVVPGTGEILADTAVELLKQAASPDAA